MLLKITGRLIQVVAVLVVLVAVLWALAMPSYYAAVGSEYSLMSIPGVMQTQQMQTALVGFLVGIVIFAFGGICCAVAQTARNSERTAEAIEAIAERRKAAPRQ